MTARIDEVLRAAVAAGAVPGVVAMAAGPDGVLYEGAAGLRSAAADDPVGPDTMMRIASMTKMVTTTAALQLIERGSLRLDTPVREYRPEFADLPVLTGFDGDIPQLRAAGSGSWAGLFNTHFWVDPASGITGAIYSQTLPFADPPAFQLYADFEAALYASL
jgi:methyl acetate hydrolase